MSDDEVRWAGWGERVSLSFSEEEGDSGYDL